MNVYVLDVPRFDKTRPPRNVREERYVVFATLAGDVPCVEKVLDLSDGSSVYVGTWASAERYGLYEEIRKAEGRWTTSAESPEVPGRIA